MKATTVHAAISPRTHACIRLEPVFAAATWNAARCRLWVKLGPRRAQPQCLLYPPITDINDRRINVGFVPWHKVAALQPAAREQEPRDWSPMERTAIAGLPRSTRVLSAC